MLRATGDAPGIPDDVRSPILRGIASNYAALAVQVAWLAVLTPLVIGQCGTRVFGEWTIVLSVAGYLRILDLGLGTTVARFVAAEPDRERPVVATAVGVLCGLAAVGVAVAI